MLASEKYHNGKYYHLKLFKEPSMKTFKNFSLSFNIILTYFFILISSISVAQAEKLQTLVLNDANSAPFTNKEGTGLVDVVAGEAFRRAGLKLKLIQLPAERALQNANNGIDDGEVSRVVGINNIYTNLVQVEEKLVDHHFVAFTQSAKLKNVTWKNLKPYSVGYIRGYKIIEKNLPKGTETSTANNAMQLFNMLDKGRVDIAIYRRWEGVTLAKQMGIKNINIIEPSLAETGIYIYLHKKHLKKVPLISSALKDIKTEGLFKRACIKAFASFNPLPEQCESK